MEPSVRLSVCPICAHKWRMEAFETLCYVHATDVPVRNVNGQGHTSALNVWIADDINTGEKSALLMLILIASLWIQCRTHVWVLQRRIVIVLLSMWCDTSLSTAEQNTEWNKTAMEWPFHCSLLSLGVLRYCSMLLQCLDTVDWMTRRTCGVCRV